MKVKRIKSARIANQFILSVGDDGAILTHFQDNKLANKLFVDSPISPDVKLIERLLSAYPKLPIRLLVDVIEQNYSQQVLPPVSRMSVQKQVDRRMARDFQPNDLNNSLSLGRNKEGRKDWNFLFISLANTAPFSKWLEVVLGQRNKFDGVYLLPVEAMKFATDINKAAEGSEKTEWELFVFHNKVGGLRIVALKAGKLIFTRLAQNLIGDNIAEITVGNMEQEISNTVEYLKRLGFKSETASKITIISSTEILQKVDSKALKFGVVDTLTPFQAAEKLGLKEIVGDKDKFADILIASHFASVKKHELKFTSKYTRSIGKIYGAIFGIKLITGIMAISLLGFAGYNFYQANLQTDAKKAGEIKVLESEGKLKDILDKKNKLPKNIDKIMEIVTISNLLPKDKFQVLRILAKSVPIFDAGKKLNKITYKVTEQEKKTGFEMEISFNFPVPESEQDRMNVISQKFLEDFSKLLPKCKVVYLTEPKISEGSQLEKISGTNEDTATKILSIPASVKITGVDNEI